MGIKIVGVGPAEGYLTDRAKEIISSADVVFGSKRALKLAEPYIRGEKVEMSRFDEDEMRMIEIVGAEKRVAVLSTGDPMVSGLGILVKGEIEPGISSVQLALAKLGIDLCETVIVDAHGKDSYHEIIEVSKIRNKVLILADREFDLKKLVEFGKSSGVKIARLAVLSNLGMEDEEIAEIDITTEGVTSEMVTPIPIKSDLSIVYAEVYVEYAEIEMAQTVARRKRREKKGKELEEPNKEMREVKL